MLCHSSRLNDLWSLPRPAQGLNTNNNNNNNNKFTSSSVKINGKYLKSLTLSNSRTIALHIFVFVSYLLLPYIWFFYLNFRVQFSLLPYLRSLSLLHFFNLPPITKPPCNLSCQTSLLCAISLVSLCLSHITVLILYQTEYNTAISEGSF